MGSNVTAPQLSDPIAIPGTTASMPRPGFGVYKIPASVCNEACLTALDAGYRHIDCAQLYRTESHVGEAARESPIPRSEIFLTTKVKKCGGIRQPTVIYEQLLDSVTKIGGHDGYVDLFLIHTPRFDGWTLREAWTCLERLFREGRARAIGVSNFGIGHIEDMKAYAEIWPPHVIQIELHPWCQQRELVEYCQTQGIIIQAYSPLATGARLFDSALMALAQKHERSSAQILIRYSLQKGWVPLPKSQTPARIRQNFQVLDFELDPSDMKTLDALDQGAQGALFPANVS